MKFKLGDAVTWTSQSKAYVKTKMGKIVLVVPPDHASKVPWSMPGQQMWDGLSLPRNHESYVVRVGSKLYWPRVSKLRLAEKERIRGGVFTKIPVPFLKRGDA